MDYIDIMGFVGLILLLSAFILNQMKVFPTESIRYHVFNCVGAYILTFYAFVLGNTPFIILEFVWGSFSLFTLIRMPFKKS